MIIDQEGLHEPVANVTIGEPVDGREVDAETALIKLMHRNR